MIEKSQIELHQNRLIQLKFVKNLEYKFKTQKINKINLNQVQKLKFRVKNITLRKKKDIKIHKI